jgi:hypothetical protein
VGNETVRREFNEKMERLHDNVNNRPYRMTLNPELMLKDEMEVIGTRSNPCFRVSDFKPRLVGAMNKNLAPAVATQIVTIIDEVIEELTQDVHVHEDTKVTSHPGVSIPDAIILMNERIGPAAGVNDTAMMRAEDATFKHHGIRHPLNFTLSNEQRAMSIMRQQEMRTQQLELRTDGLEVRMDSVEERVGKVEEMVRRLVCVVTNNPGSMCPDTIARSLCRMSDCNRQIRMSGAVLVDVQSRHTQERRLLRTSRKTQPSVASIWPDGHGTIPCYSCKRTMTAKEANVGHVVPSMKGTNGTHSPHNLELLCIQCNMQMSSSDADFWIDCQSSGSD